MPSYVVKCARDVDLFMLWSDVVEAPTAIGTEAEMYRAHGLRLDVDPDRIRRAVEFGTSALWPSLNDRYLDWDDEGCILEQRGYLPRRNFLAFAQRWPADVTDLLEPFEDEDEVRPDHRAVSVRPTPEGTPE